MGSSDTKRHKGKGKGYKGWSKGYGKYDYQDDWRYETSNAQHDAAKTWGSTGSDFGRSTSRHNGGGKNESGSCRIKISNVPRGLNRRDVRDAFKECGPVKYSEMEGDVVFITFEDMASAKRAVATFDRGEMNGNVIYVTHH